jgi:putative ABC transport system permease protein
MKFAAFVLRNLLYQWRGNLAVLLGVALGAAVLTGGLLVGDSLRGSLRDLTLGKLGWAESTLAPGRLFTEALAAKLPSNRHAGVLLFQGSASLQDKPATTSRMQLFGVKADFWDSSDDRPFWDSDAAEVVLSDALARALGVKVGDSLWLNVQKNEDVPRESLMGKRKSDDVLEPLSVKVRRISGEPMANFAMRSSPEASLNAFVPLAYLQSRLELDSKINVVLLAGYQPQPRQDGNAPNIREFLSLRDWGLKLLTPKVRAHNLMRLINQTNKMGDLRRNKWQGRIPDELAKHADEAGVLTPKAVEEFYSEKRRYLQLQSDRLFLDANVEAALRKSFPKFDTDKTLRPSLIYLADTLRNRGPMPPAFDVPYVTVAAVRSDQIPEFPAAKDEEGSLKRGIVLVDWPGAPGKAKVGDQIDLMYYRTGSPNDLALHDSQFTVRGIIPLAGDADDPDWTPAYPGLTDKLDISGWSNPPFPPYTTKGVLARIKPADDEYWKRYRATPRAYISLEAGQEAFGTRFGKMTSLRIDVPPDQDPEVLADQIGTRVLDALDLDRGGFVVQNVREQAERAASGSTDFGVLFLSFSFFLILSALVLVGLLVRLNLERRAQEIGLLAATGWGPGLIGLMLAIEAVILILLGAAAGVVGARAFASAMLRLLAVNWPGEGTLQFLTLHETPLSYAIGFGASAIVSAATVWWAFRILRKRTPRQLLAGETSGPTVPVRTGATDLARKGWWSLWVLLGSSFFATLALVIAVKVKSHEVLAAAFFLSGFLFLVAMLTAAWRWLSAETASDPQPTLVRLGMRNARRNPVRSLLTVCLLAAATFLIVAVQAFRREPAENFFSDRGGSGGFRLYAQTDIPVFERLGDKGVLAGLGVEDAIIAKIQDIQSLRLQPGDDASCLNLYQPLQPRVLGVPDSLIGQNRFSFVGFLDERDPRINPWLHLKDGAPDGAGQVNALKPIAAFVDANSAEWILKVHRGGPITVKGNESEPVRVAELLRESFFQSEILVGESRFLQMFPKQEGYQFFLVRCDADDENAVQKALTAALANHGGQVAPTFGRLKAYLAVENTYLATFQALGGLGLLLGAIGLAIVLVRGIWERRAELALLRALGFQSGQLAAMILAENGSLLLCGLGIGCAAALITIAPQLAGGEAKLVWGQIAGLLAVVSVIGLGAGALAALASLRTPVLTALRRE